MGIGDIRKALGGFVKDVGQKSAALGTALAKAPVLESKLTQVNLKLAGLKGWGPEVKVQRKALEAERTSLQDQIKENAKALPDRNAVIRNLK